MLQISDLTYRVAGRPLFEGASAFLADGWKVGLIGRNGSGKSTLLRMISEAYAGGGDGSIRIARGARMGSVEQEVQPSDIPLIETVLAADLERAALMDESETATDPDRIGEIHARLMDIDAWSAPARAAEILTGLGFAQDDLDRPARAFSGGWRMRAALAGVLAAQPELLVLDEPTNYLDLEGASWLESYLTRYPHTVVMVSHDREMLNRSVTHILALVDRKLEVEAGGYDTWLRRRSERTAVLSAQKAKQDAERQRIQSFVDRFKAKASKARQAQSRIKMLERMQDISVPLEDRAAPFHLEEPEMLAAPLVVLDQAQLGYEAGRPVLSEVSFRLDPDDRIVIIGPNGQGKTTLVKSLAGRLSLMAGRRTAARALRVGYFSQDQLDELRPADTVLAHVRDLAPELSESRHRAMAARMGFGAEKIATEAGRLSGGEKVRLLFGLMAHAKPHVLVLDEPTSHLDIDSREALIHALNGFTGAVLLITHDVYLAEATADRLWLVHDGRARPYDGDLEDYRALVLDADRRRGREPPAPKRDPAPAARVATGPRVAPSELRKRLKAAETRLESVQARIAALDSALSEPDVFVRDPSGAKAAARERGDLETELARAESEWLEVSEALEGL